MTALSNIVGSTEVETHISVMGDEGAPPVSSIEDAFAVAIASIESTDFYIDFVSTYDDSESITGYSDISAEHATTLETIDEGFPITGVYELSWLQLFDGLDATTVIGFGYTTSAENAEFDLVAPAEGIAFPVGDMFTVYDAGTPSSIYVDSVEGGEDPAPTYVYGIDGGTP